MNKAIFVIGLIAIFLAVAWSGCIEDIDEVIDDVIDDVDDVIDDVFADGSVNDLVEHGQMPEMKGYYGSYDMLSVDDSGIFEPDTKYSIKFHNPGEDQKYIWRMLPEPYTGDTWSIKIYIDQNPNPSVQYPQFVDIKLARADGIQICDVYFQDDGRIRIRGSSDYNQIIQYNWNYNTVYTIKWSNINYQTVTADVSINSYTVEDVPLYVYQGHGGPTSIGKLVITNQAYQGERSVYFTDWTE